MYLHQTVQKIYEKNSLFFLLFPSNEILGGGGGVKPVFLRFCAWKDINSSVTKILVKL